MNDDETEMLLEGIKITIAMQQGMSTSQTEGCNEAIDRLSNCMSMLPESAIILGGGYRQILSYRRKNPI
jgi:hypothetical protein